MTKYIVFCADGTWNGPGEADHDDQNAPSTNVFKTFVNLDGEDSPEFLALAKEQERTLQTAGGVVQIAKYLHGVGDSGNLLVKLMGGTLGAGLITRIVRGYTFVSRNYRAGDKIVLLGFSRGAYTVRSLAGMIAAKGLLDATRLDLSQKDAAYRMGAAVWYAYRKTRITHDTWLGHLEEELVDLPAFITRTPTIALIAGVPIEAVAVWDTVGSLGIPEYNDKMVPVDAFQFCDTSLSASVGQAIHCVAVDEQRANFTPTLWDPDPRITQVLFPGAHADVGGGQPMTGGESGLSDGALVWMTQRLAALGIKFRAQPQILPAPNPAGVAHAPWRHPPWTILGREPRSFRPDLLLHGSVPERITAGPVVADPGSEPAPYDPTNLGAYLVAGKPVAGVAVV